MKNQQILFAAALLSLGVVSCQKEKVISQFTARIEQSSAKISFDGTLLKWSATGDVVKVYSDGATGADFDVTPRENNATWAVLSGSIAEGASYTAIYPAAIAASASSVTLPAVQHSPAGGLTEFPMYAESTTDEFQFQNLCGALRIHLDKANCTISRIKVKAGASINGTYAVNVTGGVPVLGSCANGSTATTLELDTAQCVTGGHDFYIYLPAGEYEGMEITFYRTDGYCCTKSVNTTIERSVCSPITFTGDFTFADPNLLSGIFSVSSDKQVRFSCGNLQYVDGAWRFAEHQYDVLGSDNDCNNAWDLFGWSNGTSNNYGMSTSTTFSDYSGNFVDWGTAINPGGAATPWRTLSKDEWTYLINTRYRAANLHGWATVAGMGGQVLMPDGWTGSIASSYSADAWAQMEASGAVFLPAAGRRSGTNVNAYDLGDLGAYWSSTYIDAVYAYSLRFGSAAVLPNYNFYRYYGQAVRLVQDNN